MLERVSSECGRSAIEANDRPGRVTAQTAEYVEKWFKNTCRDYLGSDPGLALHVETGVPERSCYRYASGERELPIYMLWKLFQTPNGWQWLCAFMGDSQVIWWIETKRFRVMASILIELRERIDALK